ncbi:hypothetical protein [Streptomyces sp. BE230]|nr:hypothetical protein [Streptomyces sp. BE230]
MAPPHAAEGRRVPGLLSFDFGTPIDLTATVVGLTLETGGFPRD